MSGNRLDPSAFITPMALRRDQRWTDGLVERFLVEPDKTRVNMRHKSGPPVKFYAMSRVLAAEGIQEFRAALAAMEPRRTSARITSAETAERKRAEIIARVNAMPIGIAELSEEQLLEGAIESYNSRLGQREGSASTRSDPAFLERIHVNYPRQCLTHYDEALDWAGGKVGVDEAKRLIGERDLHLIGAEYQDLEGECSRQAERGEH